MNTINDIQIDQENFMKVLNECERLRWKKLNDYGLSFKKHGSFGLRVRMHDKYSRFLNLQHRMANFENIRDTAIDLVNYTIMFIKELDEEIANEKD